MKLAWILFSAALLILVTAVPASPGPQSVPETGQIAADSLGIIADSTGMKDLPTGDTHRGHIENTVFRREPPVSYHREGRRDPFRALIVDEKKPDVIETDLLIVDGATLTGVVWAEGRYLAMVRDKDGKSFFLHEGDPVYQGRVTLVTQNQANFEISDFGDYQKVTLRVQVKDKG
jgi:hypothetical protein